MAAAESLFECLEQVPDPRRARGVRHPFQAILRLTPWGRHPVLHPRFGEDVSGILRVFAQSASKTVRSMVVPPPWTESSATASHTLSQ